MSLNFIAAERELFSKHVDEKLEIIYDYFIVDVNEQVGAVKLLEGDT